MMFKRDLFVVRINLIRKKFKFKEKFHLCPSS